MIEHVKGTGQKPKIGDLLVTSGRANIYPKNILVGKVIRVSSKKITALPYVDTKKIEFVQIIKKN